MQSSLFNLIPLSGEFIAAAVLFSVATFAGTILAIPWILTRIPEDYFRKKTPPPSSFRSAHPLVGLLLNIVKNFLGVVLLVLGILMLVIPGQGILTIVAASFLLQFPNKYRLQRRLVRQPRVLSSINWLRRRQGKTPLQFEE